MTDSSVRAPRRRSTASRVAAAVAAAAIGLIGFGLLAAGAVLMWADTKKDDQGYISTTPERFTTSTSALVTEDLDVHLDGAGWVFGPDDYGRLRLQATGRTGAPVFVGIARTRDAAAYLRGTAHTLVTDIEADPFRATYADSLGDRAPAAPASARIWAASAQGAGRQSLEWDITAGKWSIVVMNADGSPGVDAGVRAGVDVPALSRVGWGSLAGGTLLLLGAMALVAFAIRIPRRPGSQAAPAPRAIAA